MRLSSKFLIIDGFNFALLILTTSTPGKNSLTVSEKAFSITSCLSKFDCALSTKSALGSCLFSCIKFAVCSSISTLSFLVFKSSLEILYWDISCFASFKSCSECVTKFASVLLSIFGDLTDMFFLIGAVGISLLTPLNSISTKVLISSLNVDLIKFASSVNILAGMFCSAFNKPLT